MNEVNYTLHRITRGIGIVFIGTIISMLFGFLTITMIARFFSKSEYGTFNLALTIFNFILLIATIGSQNSLPREISFYKEKEISKLGSFILTVLYIIILSSLTFTIILIFGSGYIGQIFKDGKLPHALEILALALPFSTLVGTFVAISQGFGRIKEKVFFQNIMYPILLFIFVLVIILLKINFYYIFAAYVISQAITFFVLITSISKSKLLKLGTINLKLGKKFIDFSLPLMFTGIAGFILTWTDTLMIGYFKTSEAVGLYNSAAPLAKLLPIFLNCAAFMYPPLATTLYAQGKIQELKRVYQVLTKWIFLATLPLFIIMFLFPETTIVFFFGKKYLGASKALQILALGFMFHTFLGLNGFSLTVIGQPKLNMVCNAIAVLFNILINIQLIPKYGITGAAIATTISYFIANIFRSFWLYKKTKIHPFSRSYIKLIVIFFILTGLIISLHLNQSIWIALLTVTLYLISYITISLLTKTIEKEDIELILIIEKKIGLNLKTIKKLINKFT